MKNVLFITFILSLLLLLNIIYSQDPDSIFSKTYLVNDVRTFAYFSKVDANSSGNAVVVWPDERYRTLGFLQPGDGASDIFAQLYVNFHTPLGNNFRVSWDTTSNSLSTAVQWNPDVAINENGRFVIVWEDTRLYTSASLDQNDIFTQMYDAIGIPIGDNFRINQGSDSSFNDNPKVSWITNQNFIVSWINNSSVYARILDNSGNPVTDYVKISEAVHDSVFINESEIIILPDSTILIYWTDTRKPQIPFACQKMNMSGELIGPNRFIPYLPSHTEIDGPFYLALSNDRFVFTYAAGEHLKWDIYYQLLDMELNPIGSAVKVNDDSLPAIQHDPIVSCDETGQFIIVWNDQRGYPYHFAFGDRDLYSQRYDANGTPIGKNFKINQTASDSLAQYLQDVYFVNGIFGVTWNESYQLSGPGWVAPIEDFAYYNIQSFDLPDTTQTDTVIFPPEPELPSTVSLYQNYPNPFNNTTTIEFEINEAGRVMVEIYNALGQKIGNFLDETLAAGKYQLPINLNGTASGLYFYALRYKGHSLARKMLLIQ